MIEEYNVTEQHKEINVMLRIVQKNIINANDHEEILALKKLKIWLLNLQSPSVSKRELAKRYNMSQRSFARKLKKSGCFDVLNERFGTKKRCNIFTHSEINVIYEYFGQSPLEL